MYCGIGGYKIQTVRNGQILCAGISQIYHTFLSTKQSYIVTVRQLSGGMLLKIYQSAEMDQDLRGGMVHWTLI